MPCYDGMPNEPVYVYANGVDPDKVSDMQRRHAQELQALAKRKEWAEAALCAIINNLEERGIAGQVIAEASRNGLIDLMTFWSDHSLLDEVRVAAFLHRSFSKDEQKIVKRLLADKE
jgi:hypothetical protein